MSEVMTFAPFDEPDLARWLVDTRADYIEARTNAGDSIEEAETNADRTLSELLPGGSPAPGQLIGRLVSHNGPVGILWIGPAGRDPERWWVWDVAIDDDHRGQGLGRAAMLLAERLARAQGARTIGLNVFAGNAVARSLYGSLGYEETAVQMRKGL
jgi:ribosomal protein S18 acetylase RimI-like enzyme